MTPYDDLGLAVPMAGIRWGGLPFYTALETANRHDPEPDWIVPYQMVAIGAITEIDGKIKSAGKTTLILEMVRCVLDGSDFMARPTRQAKVIYVTEQSPQTFGAALARAGLTERGDELRILYRPDIGATAWQDVVQACRQDGYELVVFDTIGKLAGIKEENAAGEWTAAMGPLQDLAASGRAVVLARHDRKGGGDIGESGRGSSAASGDVDIIIHLHRPEGRHDPATRVLDGLGRYGEWSLTVRLDAGGYSLIGTTDAVAFDDAVAFIRDELRVSAATDSGASPSYGRKTRAELEKAATASGAIASRLIQDALERMGDEIVRDGAGRKGSPYVYSLAGELSDVTPNPMERVTAQTAPTVRTCPSCHLPHPVRTTCLEAA